MSLHIQEALFCVLAPAFFFFSLACLITGFLYLVIPNFDDFLRRHGFDFEVSEEDNIQEIKKIPAYAAHKQELYGIYANGKFDNPKNDYNTEKRELQEV